MASRPARHLCLLLGTFALAASAAEHRVASPDELERVMEQTQPGDTLILANGVWKDREMVIRGSGTGAAPITVTAQTPGAVVFSAASSLSIEGTNVVVSGLWMKNCIGTKDIVALKGRRCRLTESAVTATTGKFYVHLYGAENRVDHCYLAGKTSDSPTLQVEVDDTPNRHRVDHNHFGPRPPLGRNGGETMRVGYSHQSMRESGTLVEANLFDRCDGELEIISNKSCGNTYRGNTFLDCAGMFTLRHGNRCIVERNFFFGHHKKGSGGIRVIGEDHTIVNNYIDGVEQGAFWITSGIVDSPLNGYFQAKRCTIAFNTVVESRGPLIDLSAGFGSSQRTLRPENITIANNLIRTVSGSPIFKGEEGEGFKWEGNLTNSEATEGRTGWKVAEPKLELAKDGMWRPTVGSPAIGAAAGSFAQIIADIDGQARVAPLDVGCDQASKGPVVNRPLTASEVGASWYRDQAGQ